MRGFLIDDNLDLQNHDCLTDSRFKCYYQVLEIFFSALITPFQMLFRKVCFDVDKT